MPLSSFEASLWVVRCVIRGGLHVKNLVRPSSLKRSKHRDTAAPLYVDRSSASLRRIRHDEELQRRLDQAKRSVVETSRKRDDDTAASAVAGWHGWQHG